MTQTPNLKANATKAGSTATMFIGWTLALIGLVVFVVGEPVGGGLLVLSGAILHVGALIAESVRG